MKDRPMEMLSGEYVDVNITKLDYTKEYAGGPSCTMHILGKTKGGSDVHLTDSDFDPYFYVPKDEFGSELEQHDKVTRWERGHENIKGNEVVKVFTRIPTDVAQIRNDYTHHEADILFPNRYLIDKDLYDGIRIPKEYATSEPTEVDVDELERVEVDTNTRKCFCDIEVYNKHCFPDEEKGDMPITSICVYDSYLDEYKVYLYHEELPEIHHDEAEVYVYGREYDMLVDFCDYIKRRNFDVIAGWNFTDFDAKYLINRLETLDDKVDEEVSSNQLSELDSAYDDGWFGGKIKGISVFDMLAAYKNMQFTELDSFKLESVAQDILDYGKIENDKELWELWEDDPQSLVDYNVKDVELTVRIEEQEDIIKFNETVASIVGGRVSEVIDPSNAVDIRVLRQVNGEYAVPSAKNVESDDFEGGQVFDPITGVRDNVIVLDLKSLYPMSMKTINAGPRTKDPDGDIVAPNGVRFTDEYKSIVVDIIDELLDEREELKSKRDSFKSGSQKYNKFDRQQRAVKVIMNTLYGVLGWSRFRLYDKEVGAAVTSVGRKCIEYTEEVANELGYEVIYGDTDSVMLELGSDVSEDEAISIGEELEDKINDAYDEFAKQELNVDDHYFQIEFEKLYESYFQAGKKKRYAGHITYKDGKHVDDTDIVGYETNRSDYSTEAQELLSDVISIILDGGSLDDISERVNETIDRLESGEVSPDNYGIPSSIGQSFDAYDSPTLAVRASEYSNEAFGAGIQPGDKPKGMYVERVLPDSDGNKQYKRPPSTKEGAMKVSWLNFNDVPECYQWDWDTYIEKQLKGPIERVLAGTDWSWSEVISGDRQPSLGEYDASVSESDNDMVLEVAQDQSDDEDDKKTTDHDVSQESMDKAAQKIANMHEALEDYEGEDVDEGEVQETSTIEKDRDNPSIRAFIQGE